MLVALRISDLLLACRGCGERFVVGFSGLGVCRGA